MTASWTAKAGSDGHACAREGLLMRRGIVLVGVAAVVALIWLRPAPPPPAQPTPTSTAATTLSAGQPPPATWPSDTAPAPKTTKAPPTASPRPQPLHGKALAVAWLNGYLNRTDRDDDDWSQAISDHTTPELVEQLKALGPDNVGLPELKSWRVTKITGYDSPNKPVDTPSRQVLTYIATVTDGRTKIDKPFELYSYLAEDGRWVITSIEQPFITEE